MLSNLPGTGARWPIADCTLRHGLRGYSVPRWASMVGPTARDVSPAGGFVGFALGFRYVFAVAELMALYSWVDADLGGSRVKLNSPVYVPSWGLRGTF